MDCGGWPPDKFLDDRRLDWLPPRRWPQPRPATVGREFVGYRGWLLVAAAAVAKTKNKFPYVKNTS